MICIELAIDVVEMNVFGGLKFSAIFNKTLGDGNGTVVQDEITFPSSLFENALGQKLANGR